MPGYQQKEETFSVSLEHRTSTTTISMNSEDLQHAVSVRNGGDMRLIKNERILAAGQEALLALKADKLQFLKKIHVERQSGSKP